MKIAVVTGSRDWPSYGDIAHDLDQFAPDLIVHGKCTRGADCYAEDYAIMKGIPRKHFHANWKYAGKRAGPLRNHEMIKYAEDMDINKHQVKVFAYRLNESSGTSDCIRRARVCGLDILVRDMVSEK